MFKMVLVTEHYCELLSRPLHYFLEEAYIKLSAFKDLIFIPPSCF